MPGLEGILKNVSFFFFLSAQSLQHATMLSNA